MYFIKWESIFRSLVVLLGFLLINVLKVFFIVIINFLFFIKEVLMIKLILFLKFRSFWIIVWFFIGLIIMLLLFFLKVKLFKVISMY